MNHSPISCGVIHVPRGVWMVVWGGDLLLGSRPGDPHGTAGDVWPSALPNSSSNFL